MNRKRLIVVLETEIYIYDISTMKLLHTIETGPNPNGELNRTLGGLPVRADDSSRLRPLVLFRTKLPRLPFSRTLGLFFSSHIRRPSRSSRTNNRRCSPVRHHKPIRPERHPGPQNTYSVAQPQRVRYNASDSFRQGDCDPRFLGTRGEEIMAI